MRSDCSRATVFDRRLGLVLAIIAAWTLLTDPVYAQRYDVGGGAVATFTPPPGWEPYENPAWSALHEGDCWRTPTTGARVCARTVETGGRTADAILADERAAIGLECTEEQTRPEDLPDGGQAVWLVCVEQGLFGAVRRTWLSLVVPGPTHAMFLEGDESSHDDAVQRALHASMSSVRIERAGPVPREGMRSRVIGGGWWLWYDPPSGWRPFSSDEHCFSSPGNVGTICFAISYKPDMTVEQALDAYTEGVECVEREDLPTTSGSTPVARRRCIVRAGPNTERVTWVVILPEGSNNAAVVRTNESELVDSIVSELTRSLDSVIVGRR